MKKLTFILSFFLLITCTIHGQLIKVNGVESFLAVENKDFDQTQLSPEDIRKIKLKKYLTEGFKPSSIDGNKEVFYLRYNMYEDQMEFVKEEKVYFLKKNSNLKILFRTLKKTYKCMNLNGDLNYFLLHIESEKLGLVTRESVKFIKPQKAKTSYGTDKPADYRRQKDITYFTLNNELYKVPKKKKDFLAFFKSNQNEIKKFMKAKKLGYKNIEDLKMIVTFNNSLN